MAWAPDYADTDDLGHYLGIPDDADDVELALAITAASRAIDRYTGRQFGSADATRYYTPEWDRNACQWRVSIDDIIGQPTSVMVDYAGAGQYTGEVLSYRLLPVNAPADGLPYTELAITRQSLVQPVARGYSVAVLGEPWGWAAVPEAVEQACLMQASRLFARRGSPFGIAGSPEVGSELRLLARVDPDVAVVLNPYVRWWGAV